MIEITPLIAVEQGRATSCDKKTLLISRKLGNVLPIFVERMTSGQKRRAYLATIKLIAKKILRR
jgi:hypothetical protein